jgi:DNA (cytosine-5)-methyltransferase 1
VIGGPPCQSFSILGARKSTGDPRGKLVYEYARFIREIGPQAFLFENVPGILTVNKGADWKELLSFFESETGYHIHWTKLNSVWFGVPQFRQRVIAVGFRDQAAYERFKWPRRFHSESWDQPELGMQPPRPAEMAFEDVAHLPNHVLREHCERVVTRYSQIAPGGRDRKDHTDRVHPQRPSGTVLVGSGAGGGRPFIHPTEHRHITVREAARLQSFPDWREFSGGPTAAYRQVGNAGPPIMAKAVAHEIANALKG